MNRPNFDSAQEKSHEANDRLNGVHNVASYVAHMERPRTDTYRVLADGSVEFIRNYSG